MWNNFFKHIDIHPENTHILDGNAADLQAECDAFEEKIKAAGGIELFVGGELDTAAGVRARPSMVGTRACLQTASLCANDSGARGVGAPAPCPGRAAQELCNLRYLFFLNFDACL